jgi:bacterioferritin
MEVAMKGSDAVLKSLNTVLVELLTTINQTFLHARICRNWGLEELDEHIYKESIRQMKVADRFISRILFLEGLPNLQELKKLRIGENVPEVLGSDLNRSAGNVAEIKSAIEVCEKERDYQSREVLESTLGDEEEFLDWLETQQSLIETMGLENYLSEKMED